MRPIARPLVVVVVVACVALAAALLSQCLTFQDHCAGVVCGDGQVCLDLARGPKCVCDTDHVVTDAGCALPAEGEGAAEGEGEGQ